MTPFWRKFLSICLVSIAGASILGCSRVLQVNSEIEREKEAAAKRSAEMQTVFKQEASKELVAVWHPRIRDINPKDEEWNNFRFLLANAVPVTYIVKKNDHLDRILRSQRFVSSSDEPRAYREYVRDIRRRNPKLKSILQPGEQIELPIGPHYEAFESQLTDERYYTSRLVGGLRVPEALAQVQDGHLPPKTEELVYRRFGYLSNAYYVDPSVAKPSKRQRKKVVGEITNRKMLPSRGLNLAVEYETVRISTNGILPPTLASAPAVLPAVESEIVDCHSGCSNCNDIFANTGYPYPPDGLSRLMIADTGIEAEESVDHNTLFYGQERIGDVEETSGKPTNPLPISASDLDDVSDSGHGTFIYREISNRPPYKGVLPDKAIYVARIARKLPDPKKAPYWDFDGKAMHDVFRYYRYLYDATKQPGVLQPTWVISLSVHSTEPLLDLEANYIKLVESDRILYVAAAGNDKGNSNLAKTIYSKADGPDKSVMVVGALDKDGVRAEYSNFDRNYVDVFAQGSCVCGLDENPKATERYKQQLNGTSQATPLVAAAATLVADKFRSWNGTRIKWRIISTSNLPAKFYDNSIGGTLNVRRALNNQHLIVLNQSEYLGLSSKFSDDIPIQGIDTNDSNWNSLLSTDNIQSCKTIKCEVLRLHRSPEDCSECFRRFVYEFQGRSDVVRINNRKKLSYFDSSGQRVTKRAKEFIDIIFPMPSEPREPENIIN